MKNLEIGQIITYTKEFAFGKTGTETATVVMVHNNTALLDNGDEICSIIIK